MINIEILTPAPFKMNVENWTLVERGEGGRDGHSPYISEETGNWVVYDDDRQGWYDTGVEARGPQGVQGPKGDAGEQGPQGIQGPKGDAGEQGHKGDTGETGAQGPKGDKGDAGEQGPRGIQGVKGDTGEAGPQGIQGPKGDKGDTGEQGPQGIQGLKGDTGAQGPKGDDGHTPVKGTDYWTDTDRNSIINDVLSRIPRYNGEVS